MEFTFDAVAIQTFLLRILHSLFILAVAIELYRSARAVEAQRLTKAFWKASLFAGSFFLSRIIAGILDTLFAFSIGWFSNIVNVIYWSILVYKARNVRLILQSPRNSELRISVRTDLDNLITRLEVAKANARKLSC
jgi:hypothetical protein